MICQRCTKNVSPEGIHTCTPTDGWRALEARISELEAERDWLHHKSECLNMERKSQDRELATLRKRIDEAPVVAWMSPVKERLEFSRPDTVYGSHTIPLISKEDLQK